MSDHIIGRVIVMIIILVIMIIILLNPVYIG